MKRRVALLVVILSLWGGVVVARLVQIQIVRHDEFVKRAASQQERTVELNAVRGSILDRQGRILAESVAGISVYADPQAIEDPKLAAKKLAAIPGIGAAGELEKRLGRRGAFAWVARQLAPETAELVRALEIPGIYFLDEHRRSYPKGTLASNLLGFVSIDGGGLAGIEHSFDRHARGRSGKATILRDARRGMYLVGGDGVNSSVDGNDVVLTIDEVIQFIAERALRRAVEEWRAPAGSVVVMDPRDGSILALASWPTFDPNDFRHTSASSWRNRPVQDLYEPGSTFKIVAAAAAIEEGIVTPSQIVDCGDGSIQIADVRIREHDGLKFGMIPFETVMAKSSNVGTIKVATSLGPRRFYSWVRKFGFGSRTGVSLPGEADGILRPPERWSLLSNAVISIGQEIAVTPLQLAAATAAVANGGILHEPRIVERVVDPKDNVVWQPAAPSGQRIMTERTSAILNEILKSVVSNGTGRSAAPSEHVAAGKTGTAQKPVRGGYHPSKTIASFTGYAPADRPRLVILVVIDEPHGGANGGVAATPVFREIADAALRYLEVEPSIPRRELRIDPSFRLAAFSQRGGQPAARPERGGPESRDTVPDLRGLDARRAVAAATQAGFEVRTRGHGVVSSQSPAPGSPGSGKRPVIELSFSPWRSIP
ncbi:MAG TPA: penicillin-binding protein [Thermoanaerobaculia bacterium]|nr:penicillin-binding protein [Thermoanaerobaculia bacterium]